MTFEEALFHFSTASALPLYEQ